MSPTLELGHVITCIGWSRAQEMAAVIIELTERHGLVCFDPQSGHVFNSPETIGSTGLRLEVCDGGVINSPDPADLRQQLQRLSN
jgi:hypothetical protein